MQYTHLIDALYTKFAEKSHEVALSNYKASDQWAQVSWCRLRQKTEVLASHLIALGMRTGQRVAIFANNSAQWSCADIAILMGRGVVVPIYPTSSQDQLKHIMQDAGVRTVFVDNAKQYTSILELEAKGMLFQSVIVFDSQVVLTQVHHQHLETLLEQASESSQLHIRLQEKSLEDLATLIYTSGTTGNPKGVMLSHKNFASSLAQHLPFVNFQDGDVSLSFLPLSHVFERNWTFFVLISGGHNVYLSNPMEVQAALQSVKPHVICVVPRFLEKIYTAVLGKVEASPFYKRALFYWALSIGRAYHKKRSRWSWKHAQYLLAKRLVLQPLRLKIAERANLIPCGGAALDEVVADFCLSIGLPVVSGYGMTETTATITCQRLHQQDPGNCGHTLDSVDIKIGENSEILVRGDTIMQGYFNLPEASNASFQGDWLKTGDAGYIDSNGCLYITDRIKELMKTSNGKYIAPQRVEGLLSRSPFIEQVAIIAEAKNYVSALIVPAFNTLESWAKEQGIHYKTKVDLIKNIEVQKKVEQSLAVLQTELARFEQVKKFTLLSQAFSIELGEVTPTLKLRRNVIYQKYKLQIASMY